jgi:hypothetical protein
LENSQPPGVVPGIPELEPDLVPPIFLPPLL